ncbi:hypothetical protein BH10BAC5_BH10BAC5_04280 [soil metagenome]
MKNLFVFIFCLLISTYAFSSEAEIASVSSSTTVTPIVEYVTCLGNGTYVVTWGYENSANSTINIPVSTSGTKNYFSPSPTNRSQPTSFLSGRQYYVWDQTVSYGSALKWYLTSENATYSTRNVAITSTDNVNNIMPAVGNLVTYTITYYNQENISAGSTTVLDSLPEGTEYVSSSTGGTLYNGVVYWFPSSINANGSGTVTVTLRVTSVMTNYTSKVHLYTSINSDKFHASVYDINNPVQTRTSDSSYIVAYEDLKGSGWNDWDINDFIAGVRERITYNGNNGITQIQYDYEALARGSAFVNRFIHKIRVPGSSTASLVVRDSNGVVQSSLGFTNSAFTDFVTANVFPNTFNALPPRPGLAFTNVEIVQQGVVKGWTATLTITTNPSAVNDGTFNRSNSDPYLLNELEREIHIASLQGTLNNTQNVDHSVDSTTTLYGYYLDLAYRLPYSWKWPLEGPLNSVYNSFSTFPAYILSSRTSNRDWYNNPDTSKVWKRRNVTAANFAFTGEKNKENSMLAGLKEHVSSPESLIFQDSAGSYFGSPKLADIDNNGSLEILIGSYDKKFHAYKLNGTEVQGFPVTTNGFIRSTAAVYVNPAGTTLITFGSDDGMLYTVDNHGALLPGFPIVTPKSIKSTPLITDLDNNGSKEIVFLGGDGKMYAVSFNGTSQPGFPMQAQTTEDNYGDVILMPSPAAADLYGDGKNEIIIGTLDKKLKVINPDGSVRFTKDLDGAVYSSPVISKISSSTYRIIIATSLGTIYVFDNNGNIINSRNFSDGFISSPVIGDIDQSGTQQLIISTMSGVIYKLNANTLTTMWALPTGQDIIASPVIADVDGDNYLDIIYAGTGGYLIPLTRNGTLVNQTTLAALEPFSSWLVSTPAAGDIDGNGKMDLVAASMDMRIKAFDLPLTSANSKVWWGSFGKDLHNTRVADSLTTTLVHNIDNTIPSKYELKQNFPNPFNPVTKIRFSVPKSGNVKILVFDMLGREITELINSNLQAGSYETLFDSKGLNSGVYFYRITTESFTDTRKMLLIK